MRRIAFTLLLLVALAHSVGPARAEVRILASPGGEVGSYLELFAAVRQSGQRVVIDGPCYSACTLVLSSIPRERVCVTRRAVLGNAPRWGRSARAAVCRASNDTVRAVADVYPADVRAWIDRHGGKPMYPRGS